MLETRGISAAVDDDEPNNSSRGDYLISRFDTAIIATRTFCGLARYELRSSTRLEDSATGETAHVKGQCPDDDDGDEDARMPKVALTPECGCVGRECASAPSPRKLVFFFF